MVNFGLYVIFIVYHHFPETPPPRYTGNICLVIRGVPKICCKWKPSIDSISSRNFVSNIRSTHWVILRSIIEFQFVLLPCWFALEACLKLCHFDPDLIWLQSTEIEIVQRISSLKLSIIDFSKLQKSKSNGNENLENWDHKFCRVNSSWIWHL